MPEIKPAAVIQDLIIKEEPILDMNESHLQSRDERRVATWVLPSLETQLYSFMQLRLLRRGQ